MNLKYLKKNLMNKSEEVVCLVGYALNAKKLRKSDNGPTTVSSTIQKRRIWTGGGLADILTDEIEEGVSFKSFDFDLPLEEQPLYHVIIHKITEDIRRLSDPESQRKVHLLRAYLSAHPNTRIIDPLTSVENVLTRSRVCHVLDTIIHNNNHTQQHINGNRRTRSPQRLFSQPKHLIVTHHDKIIETFLTSDLRFPVICKPIEACGTPNSHSMVVAMSLDGLSLVESPCIIQEYWDHSASFYKVYVIDSDVMVYRRPSLPDIQQLSLRRPLRSLIFDSRYAYPTLDDFVISDDSLLPPSYPLLHTPMDLHDISPLPGDHLSLSDSEQSYPLSSYSSTTSSSADLDSLYLFDDLTACDRDLLLLQSRALSSCCPGDGYVHHTPHRGLKPGASPSHKFTPQRHQHLQQQQEFPSHLCRGENPPATPTTQTAAAAPLPPAADSETLSSDQITQQVTCHHERFKEIASHLQKGFGLTLFGFDVLIPNQSSWSSSSSTGAGDEFLVIDVNFFPSYKEVHDFPSRLRKMLRNKSSTPTPSSL